MATGKEYLAFILDQLSMLEGITHRSMMGEYMIYYRDKLAAYLCDDRLLVKFCQASKSCCPMHSRSAVPGRKAYVVGENVDDREFLKDLFEAMYPELPETKKKADA